MNVVTLKPADILSTYAFQMTMILFYGYQIIRSHKKISWPTHDIEGKINKFCLLRRNEIITPRCNLKICTLSLFDSIQVRIFVFLTL